MIFAYAIPDGCGNHLRLTVQAESRELADKIVRHEIGHAGRKGYDFPFVDAKVVDMTKEPLLVKELWDHELGDSVNY